MSIQNKKWLKMGQNEEILWWAHPSIIRYFPQVMLGVIAILSGLILPFVGAIDFESIHPELRLYMFILVPIGIFIIITELIQRKYTYYVITTDTVWIKSGIFNTTRDPVRFDRLVNHKVHRPGVETIISWIIPSQNIGHIELNTADDNLGDLYMRDVPDVEITSDLIKAGEENASAPSGVAGGHFANNQQGQQPPQQPQGQNPFSNGGPQNGQQPQGGSAGGSNGYSKYPDK